MEKNMEKIDKEIKKKTRALKKYIKTQEFEKESELERFWGGAGVVIEAKINDQLLEWIDASTGNILVITVHAGLLSYLFKKIWEIYNPIVDSISKYTLLAIMGNSALIYIDKTGKDQKFVEMAARVLSNVEKLADIYFGNFYLDKILSFNKPKEEYKKKY